jgi:hypothetical protein
MNLCFLEIVHKIKKADYSFSKEGHENTKAFRERLLWDGVIILYDVL